MYTDDTDFTDLIYKDLSFKIIDLSNPMSR